MLWEPDDRWRDSYDAWKLASPYDDDPWRSCCAPLACECDDCLDDAERLAAMDPEASYDEAELEEWSAA